MVESRLKSEYGVEVQYEMMPQTQVTRLLDYTSILYHYTILLYYTTILSAILRYYDTTILRLRGAVRDNAADAGAELYYYTTILLYCFTALPPTHEMRW